MFISAHHELYNWNRYRSIIFKLSLSLAISSCWVVINYQKPLVEETYTTTDVDIDPAFILTPPRIPAELKPKKIDPPAKKKKPITLVVPVDKLEEPDKKENDFKVIVSDTLVNDIAVDTVLAVSPPAPIVVIVEPVEDEETIVFADQMPVFGQCDPYNLTKEEVKECSNLALLAYIHSRLRYPAFARRNNIEGTVVLRFVIDKSGAIRDVNILRDIGGGCGNAAKDLIQNLPKWLPGKQDGRVRNVQFTIPIKFDLK